MINFHYNNLFNKVIKKLKSLYIWFFYKVEGNFYTLNYNII